MFSEEQFSSALVLECSALSAIPHGECSIVLPQTELGDQANPVWHVLFTCQNSHFKPSDDVIQFSF